MTITAMIWKREKISTQSVGMWAEYLPFPVRQRLIKYLYNASFCCYQRAAQQKKVGKKEKSRRLAIISMRKKSFSMSWNCLLNRFVLPLSAFFLDCTKKLLLLLLHHNVRHAYSCVCLWSTYIKWNCRISSIKKWKDESGDFSCHIQLKILSIAITVGWNF